MAAYRPLIRKNGETQHASDDDELGGLVSSLNGQKGALTTALNRGNKVRFSKVFSNPPFLFFLNNDCTVRGPTGYSFSTIEAELLTGNKYYFELSTLKLPSVMPGALIGIGVVNSSLIENRNLEPTDPNLPGNSPSSFAYIAATGALRSHNVQVGQIPPLTEANQRVRFAISSTQGGVWTVWVSVAGGLWNGSETADPATGVGGIVTNFSENVRIIVYKSGGNQLTGFNYHPTVTGAIPAGFSLPSPQELPGVFPTDTDITLPSVGALLYWTGQKFIARYPSKELVRLENVDNTKDIDKPVSTPQAQAISEIDNVGQGHYTVDLVVELASELATYTSGKEIETVNGKITITEGSKIVIVGVTQADFGTVFTMTGGVWTATDPMSRGRRTISNKRGIYSIPASPRPRAVYTDLPFVLEKKGEGSNNIIGAVKSQPKQSADIGHRNFLGKASALSDVIGTMSSLLTEDNESLVGAINECATAADEMLTQFNQILNS